MHCATRATKGTFVLDTLASLTSLDPSGVGIGLAIWLVATAVSLYLIPALLVGLLAEAWGDSRIGWSLFAIFFGWPIALAALLILGRMKSAPKPSPLPAASTA
jgi:hypothetical protein